MKVRSPIIVVALLIIVAPLLAFQIQRSVFANQAPVASFSYSPDVPAPGETLTFDASPSFDPDGSIVTYSWDFGDGSTAVVTNPIITRSYPVDGNYTVQLVVTDNGQATGVASAVIQVRTVVFFRVCFYGTLIPVPNVEVTVYGYNGASWVKLPAGSNYLEIQYDRLTEPHLANTPEEKYRNPGYTATNLRDYASNIGFDLHPTCWNIYFKFEWAGQVAYWPNDTTRVYTYEKGIVEPHDYAIGHRAFYDPSVGTYVIRVNDIPGSSVNPTSSHPIVMGVQCPPPTQKYYLTVGTDPADIATIPGQGWYTKDTNVSLTAPSYVNVSSDTCYRFSYWDVDGASRGSGVNPIAVVMNANHTATAHYIKQYAVTFYQSGLSSDATGTVVTVDGALKTFGNLPFTQWIDTGSSLTYSYGTTVASSISGKRYRLSNVNGPSSPIVVTSPTSITGCYIEQYSVTFAQTGLDSSATGTVVTVNGVPETYANLPYSFWADSGGSVTYSYSSIVASSAPNTQFRLVAVQGASSPLIISGPVTVDGEYYKQYRVTFAQTGLDATAAGTVVTVNGNVKTYSELPYSFWIDSGSTVTYSYSTPVSSTSPSKRFRLSSITGPSSPVMVTGSTTVTGNYVIQYSVTFAQTGLDSTATGTVATADGTSITYSGLPYTMWADSGSTITYSYTSLVSSSTSGKRFRLDSISGSASPITVSGATTVSGNYVTQFSVTFPQAGLDSTATGTVVTVNGVPKTYVDLPYSFWADCGTSVTYSYNLIVSSSMEGKQFRLVAVHSPTSPFTVLEPVTITGEYYMQYQVTFSQTGLDSTAAGTVVAVNGSGKTYGDLPSDLWADSGSLVTHSYSDPVSSTTTGKRFKLTGVSGPSSPITVTSAVSVTGNYQIQYQVTFDQTGVGPDFAGPVATIDSVSYNRGALPTLFWWDKDSTHGFSFASPLVVNASKQYTWSFTSGLTALQSGTLTITASGNVIGNYVVGNRITFDQTGLSSDFSGTVVTVDGTPYGFSMLPVSFVWQAGSTHSFSFQSPLLVASNSKRYVWTSTAGLSSLQSGSITVSGSGSVVGNYRTQYYLALATNPTGVTSPSGAGWYDANTYASISTTAFVDIVSGSSRYSLVNWTTTDMAEITDPSSASTTVLIDKAKTVTANYAIQYRVTFDNTGVNTDFTGPVVTIDSVDYHVSSLPASFWWDQNSQHDVIWHSPLLVGANSKQYVWTSSSGLFTSQSGTMTVTGYGSVTGNFGTQYYLTVTSPYGTTGGEGWYDNGVTAYATLNAGMVNHGNGTRHVFTNWSGDASGTSYPQSDPILMEGAKTAVAEWKTQHSVTFTHLGLDSSATGTVVTVNGSPKTYGNLPYTTYFDAGSSVTYSYGNVSSSTPDKRFSLTGVSGPTSPVTVTNPTSVIGNYKTQYIVTFNQSGVGGDFVATVVTVDSIGYTVASLPKDFWWDYNSSHIFSFYSLLVVNAGKQYDWVSTTGLSTLQSGTLKITDAGIITGNYAAHAKYEVTFDQTGVGTDFAGVIVTVDGTDYTATNLPVSFWWDSGSSHTFTFYSPLNVNAHKRYIWTSTTGLSTLQSGTLTVSSSGSVIGNYKTQYYLTVVTSPQGIDSPTGAGWYDTGAYATISTDAYVDIVPGLSRYRFDGWSTPDMPEITDPMRSPTTVLMDKCKTVAAIYVVQYKVAFGQSGVSSDFSSAVATVDGVDFTMVTLPKEFWWDNGSSHAFAFKSPLVLAGGGMRYAWTSTAGLSTSQSGTIAVSNSGSVTGNYRTQYYLTVRTDPTGITAIPGENWYDASASVTLIAPTQVPDYQFVQWNVDGAFKTIGLNQTTITMGTSHTATAYYASQVNITASITPPEATVGPGDPVPFNSNVTGGTGPYQYQWYLNNNPVSGAISPTWSFTPSAPGTYYIYMRATDSLGRTAQSGTSRVFVRSVPVGGYSFSWARPAAWTLVLCYGMLLALLGAALALTRRKRK